MTVAWDANVTLRVEAAFGNNPLDASPTWTDISAYLHAFRTRRGRRDELNDVAAGTAVISLNNKDRRFDPTHATGPYYGNLEPMVPVRIQADYSAVTYDVFYGYAEAWPQLWPTQGNNYARCDLQLVDGFKLLGFHETAVAQSEEASHTRVGNLLDEASWPAAFRDLNTGTYTLAAITPNCQSVLQLCQEAARSEDGMFFIAADGSPTLQQSTFRSGASVTATYGDDGAELRYRGLELDYSDRMIFNEVTVVTVDGSSVTVEDTTSQTSYGKRTMKHFDTHSKDATDATTLANSILTRWKDPAVRVESLVVEPTVDPAGLWPRVLGDDLSTKYTVKRRPPGGGAAISQDVFLEGVEHTVTLSRWRTKNLLSPNA